MSQFIATLMKLSLPRVLVVALLAVGAVAGPFGPELRPLFAFNQSYTNLNHGSFGAPPLSVLQARNEALMDMEANTELWWRFPGGVYDRLSAARCVYRALPWRRFVPLCMLLVTLFSARVIRSAALAAYVSADPEDIVFVENASRCVCVCVPVGWVDAVRALHTCIIGTNSSRGTVV
jgi:hypothetical protein